MKTIRKGNQDRQGKDDRNGVRQDVTLTFQNKKGNIPKDPEGYGTKK